MRKRERRVVQTFRQVCDFVWAHRKALPAFVVNQVLPKLRRTIVRLEELAVEQDLGMRLQKQATRRQEALALSLRTRFVLPLARVARHISPELGAALRAPHKRIPRERLAQTARAMADIGERHAGAIAHDLGKSFLRDMRAATVALQRAVSARESPLRRHMAARTGVESQLRVGRDVVQHMDILMTSELAADEALAATWRKVKRYE